MKNRIAPYGTLLLALAGLAAGQESVQWVIDWDAAVQQAKDRNVPIVIAVHGDH